MNIIVTISDDDTRLIRDYLERETGRRISPPDMADYFLGLFVGVIHKHARGLRTIEDAAKSSTAVYVPEPEQSEPPADPAAGGPSTMAPRPEETTL